jgi:hypothetical protein
MTEREIQLLGFEKNYLDDDGIYGNNEYYYHYDITDGMSFISCSSKEVTENDKWFVEIFNTLDPITFYKFEEVQSLLNTLEKHLIKK